MIYGETAKEAGNDGRERLCFLTRKRMNSYNLWEIHTAAVCRRLARTRRQISRAGQKSSSAQNASTGA
jgi:hypothetical protein